VYGTGGSDARLRGAKRVRIGEAIAAARAAVVANWRPFVLIQACAALLVVAYYAVPGAAAGTAWLATTKRSGGLPFSALSTAFAGAVLPVIAKRVTGRREAFDFVDFLFQAAFFGFLGITVDLLYQLMAVIFGDVASPSVVFRKVLVDQFVYGPFISIPISTSAFLWKDAGFSFRRTVLAGRDGVWTSRYAMLLISCWAFWIPVLACVYAMPTNLQFCLFLCAQGAWGLLLLAMSGR
jgi:hypothetical protein